MGNLNAMVETSTGLEIASVARWSSSSPNLGGEGHVPATHKK